MTNVLGVYGGAQDWLGRRDPRAKLALLVASMVLAVAFDRVAVLAGLLAGGLLLAVSGRVPLGELASHLKPLAPVVLLAGILRAIFTPAGETLIELGVFDLTDQGLRLGLALAMRLLLMGGAVALWASTTHPSDMVEGFVRLGLPPAWGMALVLALRMIPRLQQGYSDITRAQRARGLVLQGSWGWRRVERLMPVMVALVIDSLRSAQAWGLALEARGFQGGQPRGHWRSLEMKPGDWALVGLSLVLLAAGLALR